MTKVVKINTKLITDWSSFHQIFKTTFGFPNYYGNNMNAWIDCMSSIADKDSGMTKVWINETDTLVLELTNSKKFKEQCFEIYLTLFECTAFVNSRQNLGNGHAFIAIACD